MLGCLENSYLVQMFCTSSRTKYMPQKGTELAILDTLPSSHQPLKVEKTILFMSGQHLCPTILTYTVVL